MSFFRYPGGKKKIQGVILENLTKLSPPVFDYREPFFGGGSIGASFINGSRAWINDIDIGIYCLWYCVIHFPEQLKDEISAIKPTKDLFHQIKSHLLSLKAVPILLDDIIKVGIAKLVIHQISYSGLGVKSGGPLGGEKQESKYKIDCRWSPKSICKKIDALSLVLKNVKITCAHYETLFTDSTNDTIFYLDPPYFKKGNDLYQHGFKTTEHIKLAKTLRDIRGKWVLSYDDCPEIWDLYSWARITKIPIKYSITNSRAKYELLITNDNNHN